MAWLLLFLLLGCEPEQERFPLDPLDVLDARLPHDAGRSQDAGKRQEPIGSLAWEAPDKQMAAKLPTPRGYRRARTVQVAPGVLYRQFEIAADGSPDPRQTLRALLVHPNAFKRLQVLFSDRAFQPLSTETVLARKEVQALMSWCFFGRIPAGDAIGLRCSDSGRNCRPGIYYLAEKRTGKNLNLRYTVAINHKAQVRVFRGGLGPSSARWYRLAMGGGLLLYDREATPDLYRAVGRPDYNKLYTSSRYNHVDFVRKGQAGDPVRSAPRSAAAILADGSLVLINLGEGKYRFQGGATPARLASLLRQLGAIRAVMFDGGGAPQMVVRNRQGRLLARSWPESAKNSNYLYNYAFLTLIK